MERGAVGRRGSVVCRALAAKVRGRGSWDGFPVHMLTPPMHLFSLGHNCESFRDLSPNISFCKSATKVGLAKISGPFTPKTEYLLV